MNKWTGYGRIAYKSELKHYGEKNTAHIKLSVAIARISQQGVTDFVGCEAWGKNAERIDKYLRKGNRIAIAGHIQTSSYAKNGQQVYTQTVMIDEIYYVETKDENREQIEIPKDVEDLEVTDLPFN